MLCADVQVCVESHLECQRSLPLLQISWGDGSSPFVLSTSYRIPKTPLQFVSRYEQGRANIMLTLTPDKEPWNDLECWYGLFCPSFWLNLYFFWDAHIRQSETLFAFLYVVHVVFLFTSHHSFIDMDLFIALQPETVWRTLSCEPWGPIEVGWRLCSCSWPSEYRCLLWCDVIRHLKCVGDMTRHVKGIALWEHTER